MEVERKFLTTLKRNRSNHPGNEVGMRVHDPRLARAFAVYFTFFQQNDLVLHHLGLHRHF